jgi:phosphatidylglycerophosphatase A
MKKNFSYKIISTVVGLGLIPLAPGTFGALGGLLSGWLVMHFSAVPNLVLGGLIIVFTFLGVYSSDKLIPEWGNDPSRIVIDEVVGMWVALLFVPNSCWLLIASFALFRFFDIVKPLFIRKLENIYGGWGIMLDDVVAGIYANVIVHLLIFLIKFT